MNAMYINQFSCDYRFNPVQDVESESRVHDSIRKEMAGKTVIAIAHRLATVANADKIVCLQAGMKVEEGTHEQLMQRNGQYAQLVRLQHLSAA